VRRASPSSRPPKCSRAHSRLSSDSISPQTPGEPQNSRKYRDAINGQSLAGGTLSGTNFVIPKANVAGDVTALLGSAPQTFAVTADGDLTGTYDPVNKAWSINVAMSGSGGSVVLSLQGALTTVSPINHPGAPQTVECDLTTGHGHVTLDGSGTTNPGGGALQISWFDMSAQPPLSLGSGPVITADLPVGVSTISERSVNGEAEALSQTTVTVVHTLNPILNVPPTATISSCAAPDIGTAEVVDSCSTTSVTNNAPHTFPIGDTTVTWTARDASGLVSTATEVVSTAGPHFTLVPPATTISSCTNAQIGEATATDACGAALSVTNNAPAKFPLGPTTVTWTARDAAGREASTTQTVTAILGDDPSCCPAGTHIIVGTAATDVIVGTSGSDCILGRGGDDVIDAQFGDDFISGGAGRDTISSGPGNDIVFGGDGDDTIDSSTGHDTIHGGAGADTCSHTSTATVLECEILWQ
jgi:hypothetical protein